MSRAIAYLSRLCRRWGGSLELVSESKFSELRNRPGTSDHPARRHAIDRPRRAVFAIYDKANPGTIIHEMGHVFLEEGDPLYTYEPDWLGWEVVLARRARCFEVWSEQNDDYEIELDDVDTEWACLGASSQRRFIADRVQHAKTIGIVSRDGVPLCTRKAS